MSKICLERGPGTRSRPESGKSQRKSVRHFFVVAAAAHRAALRPFAHRNLNRKKRIPLVVDSACLISLPISTFGPVAGAHAPITVADASKTALVKSIGQKTSMVEPV